MLKLLLLLLVFGHSNSYLQDSVTLSSLHYAKYALDFTYFMQANASCMIKVSATVSGTTQTIFDQTCSQIFEDATSYQKQIKIWNFQMQASTIHILFVETISSSQTLAYYENELIVKKQIGSVQNFINAVLIKDYTSNYMLPFNLLSQKNIKTFVEENRQVISINQYSSQPFLDTYWNELGFDSVTMPWLPYFSNCESSTSRLFIHQLLSPQKCQSIIDFYGIQSIQCSPKTIKLQCYSDQNYVETKSKYIWWANQQQAPFYLFKTSLSLSTLKSYYTQSSQLQNIVNQYYLNLVPLLYTINYDIQTQTPNVFTFTFFLEYTSSSYTILSFELVSSYEASKDYTQLQIDVHYVSEYDKFYLLNNQIYVYVVFFMTITFLLSIFIKKITALCQINLNVPKLIFPVIKGSFLASISSLSFFYIFFFTSSETNFQAIDTTFNSTTPLLDQYYGRVGFTMFVVGFYIMNAAINQSFKVLTPSETKIILEDQQLQSKQNCERDVNQQEKQNFIIKNMNSHRKYLLFYVLLSSLFLLFFYYHFIELSLEMTSIIIIFVYPLIQKLLLSVLRHLIIKELLYLFAIRVTYEIFFDLFILKGRNLGQCFLLYTLKLFSDCYIIIGLQLLFQKFIQYLILKKKYNQSNCCIFWIFYHFRDSIKSIQKESKYEKGIFYSAILSTKTVSSLLKMSLTPIIYVSFMYTEIPRNFYHGSKEIIVILLMIFFLGIMERHIVQVNIKIFDYYFKIPLSKIFEFNYFKFKRRKVRFLNDNFNQNRCIGEFYREFQKFSFSSQLYIIVFLITFSILINTIGLKIILQTNYVVFYDPVLLVILVVVWTCGQLLSILLSFIVIKFKFYDKKQDEKMRAKLDSVQKIMRKNDYSQFLGIEGVKNYFLFHCKEWIIKNLSTLLTREDFEENGGNLLSTYKYYKSLLKKREIEERKKKENEHKRTNIFKSSKGMQKELIVKIPAKPFQQFTKPLLYSWLYIAKQFSYLKKLIAHIKKSQIQDVCEFCSMNIELQAIQKHDFADIINEYRILNVGRAFNPEHFIQFYRFRQEYITVCIECKDRRLYLMKKNISIQGTPMILLKKWLMKSRSNLLHQKIRNDK